MGFEIFTIIGPMIGAIVGIYTTRLRYIHDQYEKLSDKAKELSKIPDDKLDKEIKKSKPDKALVVTLVSQLVATKRIESDIEGNIDQNSGKAIYLDFFAIAVLVLTGVIGSFIGLGSEYFVISALVAGFPAFLSVLVFLGHIQDILSFRKKLHDDK